ncbi:MAG: heme-binding protein [Sandaracinus sp.]
MRTIETLDLTEAQRAIAVMREELQRRGAAAVILVADAHGDPIALERLDGAPATSVRIASNKAWTAACQATASRAIGDRVRSAERLDVAYYGDPRICGWGGGLPIVRSGHVVGAVAVSGLPEDEDEAVAEIGRRALAGE